MSFANEILVWLPRAASPLSVLFTPGGRSRSGISTDGEIRR